MTSHMKHSLLALAMVVAIAGEARGQSQNELIEQRVLPR